MQSVECRFDLGGDLWSVGRAREHQELSRGIELMGGPKQVGQALLPRDAADEDDQRPVGIDVVLAQHETVGRRPVFVGVDAVVHHVQARRVDAGVAAKDVVGHARGDRHDSVGGFDRRPLAKRRERVTAAKLFFLPGAERLERVRGDDVRDIVQQLRHVAGEIRVPRVGVDEMGGVRRRGHRQVGRHREQRGICLGGDQVRIGAVCRDVELVARRAEAVHLDVDQPAQLARQILDVHARAAVDLGRVFTGEEGDSHDQPP